MMKLLLRKLSAARTRALAIWMGLSARAGADSLPRWSRQTTPNVAGRPSRYWFIGALLTFAFLSAGVGTVGYVYFRHQIVAERQIAQDNLSCIADLKAAQIVAWYRERLGDAHAIFKSPMVQAKAREFLAGSRNARTREELAASMTSAQEQYGYLSISLYRADGASLLGAPAGPHTEKPRGDGEFHSALLAKDVLVTDIHRNPDADAQRQRSHIGLWIPVGVKSEANARAEGVFLLDIDLDQQLYPLIQSWPTPSRTAETLLVRREGDRVVYLNELRHRKGTALSLRLPIDNEMLPAVQAVLGRKEVMEGIDYRDKPVLAAARGISGTPWFVVAKVDADEIYAPLRERGLTTAAFVLVFVVAGALGVGLIGRWRDARWLKNRLAAEWEHRLILDAADQGVLGLDRAGRHVFVNPAACRMLGYAPEELIGKPSHAIWHFQKADGSPYPSEECPIYTALRSGAPGGSDQEVFWKKDGASIPVEYTATPNPEKDRPIALVVFFRDISDRRRAESHQRMATEILHVLNRDGDLDLLIGEVLRLIKNSLGYDAVGLRMRKGDDCPYYVQHGFSNDFLREENFLCPKGGNGTIARDASGRAVLECTCGLVLSGRTDPSMPCFTEGGSFWTNASSELLSLPLEADPRTNPRNRCIHRGYQSVALVPLRSGEEIVGLLQLNDRREGQFTAELVRVFERLAISIGLAFNRKLAEELQQQYNVVLESQRQAMEELYAAAESATRAKSEFLANMSHEIRTPMTAILGYVDFLAGQLDQPEHLEALNIIRRNGDHLLTVINDILDLSKIEAGKFQVERRACSPAAVAAEVVSLMRVRARGKGLGLELEFAGPLPETVLTDMARLRQILLNLVGNAVKFTETGSVRIIVRLADRDGLEPRLVYEVVDTGIGITAAQIDSLFRPFQQAEASTSRKFGGTGLGLAISKRLATFLGGDINVRSEPGEGSTFALTIDPGPLAGVALLEHPSEAIAAPAASPARGRPLPRLDCRILLAEDGVDNQRFISFLLKKAGAEVTTVENGRKAMEMALASFPGWGRRHDDLRLPFDVILMDMQMPVMDGYEATRRLRDEGYAGPIIALTAHAMADDRQKCLGAGCDDYATKPIDRAALLNLIAAMLEKHRCLQQK